MIPALSYRRNIARLAAIGTVAVGATSVIASSAATAAPAASHKLAAGRALHTLFSHVDVYNWSSTTGKATGQLGASGTNVSITCWTTGGYVAGSPIWYQISAPVAGYVPALVMNAHFAPAAGIPHCLSPVLRRAFYSLEASLRIRTGPSTNSTVAGYLGRVGSKVTITCYRTGTAIYGDAVWYRATAPTAGYVTGRLLNTGSDPAPGVPRC